VADDRTSAVPADAASTAPSGGCEGGVALAVPQVQVIPAFQMLGSDDVGVCVDGVCAVPTSSSTPAPTASTADTEQD